MRKGELLERFMATGKKNPVYDNIIVCLFIALAGTFYYYYRINNFLSYFTYIVTAVIFLMWTICALLCGKDKKLGFLIFAYLYWLIPYIYTIWYASRDKGAKYSKLLSILNRIFNATLKNPFDLTAKKLHMDTTAMAAILLCIVMVAYAAGGILAYFYEHKYLKKDDEDIETDDIEYD